MKVSYIQEVKTKPVGCTHIYLNTIGEVYEWLFIDGIDVKLFSCIDGWIESGYEKSIVNSERCLDA